MKFNVLMIAIALGGLLPAQTITRVLGSYVPSNVSPAVGYALAQARGTAVDAAGNIYFGSGCAILKLSPAGVLDTVAGKTMFSNVYPNGCGFSGDNGPATEATIDAVADLGFDGAGNLYFTQPNWHRIRKISPSGLITTIAGNGSGAFSGEGGPATMASLSFPNGIAVASDGNIYFADSGNNRVRWITTSGNIHTWAGTGVGGFSGDGGSALLAQFTPIGVALDSSGNVYIGTQDRRVRRVLNSTGVISTIAGIGSSSSGIYTGEGGPATSAYIGGVNLLKFDSQGNLFLSCSGINRILKINSSGIITAVAGNGSAYSSDTSGTATSQSILPFGLAIDNSGNIFLTSTNFGTLNTLRKVDTSGVIQTLAGGDSTTAIGDNVPATMAQSSELHLLRQLNFSPGGDLYFTNDRFVRKINPAGIVSTVAGNGNGLSGANGLPATSIGVEPRGVAVDASGNVYFSEGNAIRKIDSSGIVGTVTSATTPIHLVVATNGDVYFSEQGSSVIRKISGGVVSTVAGIPNSVGNTGDGGPATSANIEVLSLAIDSSNQIYFAGGFSTCTLRRIDSSGIVQRIAGTGTCAGDALAGPALSTALPQVNGIAIDGGGSIFLSTPRRVLKIDPSGSLSIVAGIGTTIRYSGDGGPALSAAFVSPGKLAVDSSGNLYLADNTLIRKVTFAIPVVLGTSPAGLQLTVDGAPVTAPSNQQWAPGLFRTLSAPSPQGNSSTRYLFSSWSNSGAQTQSYTVPSLSSDSLTAFFTTQHAVSINISGNGSVSPPAGFFNAGATQQFSATAGACSGFAGFSGSVSGGSPVSLLIDAPKSLTATFTNNTAPNVTSGFTMVRGGFSFNRALNRTVQTVTLTNNTGSAVTGIRLALDGLTNATLGNSAGNTSCATPVSPTYAVGTLGAGQSVSFTLQFVQTGATINYTPRLLGNGAY